MLMNGVKMPLVGLGTYSLHKELLKKVISETNSLGYQLYDTAYLYKNEKEIGKVLKEEKLERRNLFITSKLSAYQYWGHKYLLRLDKQKVSRSFRDSCRHLATDYLDLYLLHSPFKDYTNAYKKLLDLYNEHKVLAIGVCNCGIEHLQKIKKDCGVWPMVNQVEMHPYHCQRGLVDFCDDKGIQIEAYSPFAHGEILKEMMGERFLSSMARYYRKTIPQIILRWLVQRKIVAIPRSTNKQHLKECIDIFDFELTKAEMEKISALDRNESHGVRPAKHN